jgi:hypothetical protein
LTLSDGKLNLRYVFDLTEFLAEYLLNSSNTVETLGKDLNANYKALVQYFAIKDSIKQHPNV